MMNRSTWGRVAVVIPSYRVVRHVGALIAAIPEEISRIYVIDDACPEGSGKWVEANCRDERVRVLYHATNQGVGGAVLSGYKAALADGCDVIVKMDGDGQMDPALVYDFVRPILAGQADYTKGNRFFDLERVRSMPMLRLFGNAVLSFMTKLSSGYWNLFDPTNGYTAIHASTARWLPLDKISQRYFFETDMLFRLNTVGAVVQDVPMSARYGDEISNLNVARVALAFLMKHASNFVKRIIYNYYLRDMSLASLELPAGLALITFGVVFGVRSWQTANVDVATPAGTVMLAALPIMLGLQLLLAFIGHDVSSVPALPIHGRSTAPLAPARRGRGPTHQAPGQQSDSQ